MRISSKGRYALAAMTSMAKNKEKNQYTTVIQISKNLGISKIYLEQIFSQLKKSGLLHSVKGAQGGYQLARMPQQITAFDILNAVSSSLFETPDETVAEKAPDIEAALQNSAFTPLDETVKNTLSAVTLADLAAEAENHAVKDGFMFYI